MRVAASAAATSTMCSLSPDLRPQAAQVQAAHNAHAAQVQAAQNAYAGGGPADDAN